MWHNRVAQPAGCLSRDYIEVQAEILEPRIWCVQEGGEYVTYTVYKLSHYLLSRFIGIDSKY